MRNATSSDGAYFPASMATVCRVMPMRSASSLWVISPCANRRLWMWSTIGPATLNRLDGTGRSARPRRRGLSWRGRPGRSSAGPEPGARNARRRPGPARHPHMRAFCALSVETLPQRAVARHQGLPEQGVRDASPRRARPVGAGTVHHLKLIPRQVVKIVRTTQRCSTASTLSPTPWAVRSSTAIRPPGRACAGFSPGLDNCQPWTPSNRALPRP